MQSFPHKITSVRAMNILLLSTHSVLTEEKRNELSRMLYHYCSDTAEQKGKDNPVGYLIGLASYHGVLPLLYHTLQVLLKDENSYEPHTMHHIKRLYEAMKEHYAYITQKNMYMSAQLLHFLSRFEKEDIAMLAFKGPTLAVSAYGDITLRQFGDIDILVHRRDVPQIMKIMDAEGYLPDVTLPEGDAEHYYDLLTTIGFDNPVSKMRIEVHWELLSHNYAVAWKSDSLWHKTELVTLNRKEIPVLAFEDMLVYLCLHGSKHLFERMEWVCDIDRMIRTQENIDWKKIITSAKQIGVFRMLLLGLSLASDFYDLPLPDEIRKAVSRDKTLPLLKSKILSICYDPSQTAQKIDKEYFFTVLRMRERFRDRMRFGWQALFATQFNDLNYIRLPKYLHFLYPIVRLYRLVRKYISGR
jgi:hypothetical protein